MNITTKTNMEITGDQMNLAGIDESAVLANLLNELGADDGDGSTETFEAVGGETLAATGELDESALQAELEAELAASGNDEPPSTDKTAVQPEKKKGGKKGKKAAAAKEAAQGSDENGETAPAPEATKEPAAPNPLRNPFAKKSEKLAARLGDQFNDYLVLEMADATLSPEELKAKQDALLTMLDLTPTSIHRKAEQPAVAKKVADKALTLFGWLKNGGELNEVMKRAFKVLARDGQLTSGDKGNLQLELLAKPYSLGTARSQANQMFTLMPLLKLCSKEKGRMVPNPDSLLLPTVLDRLGAKQAA